MENIERILNSLDVVSCIGDDKVGDFSLEQLSEELRLSTHEGDYVFLTRGHEGFESSCAKILHRLKKLYPRTLCFAVKKYEDQKIYGEEFYDGVIFPPCLKDCDKSAIDRYFDDYFLKYSDFFICGQLDLNNDLLIEVVQSRRIYFEIGKDAKKLSCTWDEILL